MDLQGNIISIKSFKEISRAEIINYIISYGKTVLISTDVYPPPKMVKKLASALNAKIHHPDKDMSVGSKIDLVESYMGDKTSLVKSKVFITDELPQNAHERDALAAAIRTYKKYQAKLRLAENRSINAGLPPEQIEDIKIMFIEGKAISTAIQSMVELNLTVNNNDSNGESVINNCDVNFEEESLKLNSSSNLISKFKHKVKIQERQIRNLKSKNNILKGEIKDYKKDLAKLHHKIDKLYYQYNNDILYKKEMASKLSLIKKLEVKYNREKTLRMELEDNLKLMGSIQTIDPSENVIPVKIIETFTREGILNACEYWKIKNDDLVLLKNSEGGGSQTASQLISMGVKAVLIIDNVSHNAEEEFERNMVPLLKADQLDLKIIDQFAIVDNKNLQIELGKWKAKIESKMLEENNQEILNVIYEYRAKRKRLANP
jgi:predicted RNase H-like nuclease (RuvC/YqgF family)